jgi:hypothetical protein
MTRFCQSVLVLKLVRRRRVMRRWPIEIDVVLPNVRSGEAEAFRSKIVGEVDKLARSSDPGPFELTVRYGKPPAPAQGEAASAERREASGDEETDRIKFIAVEPLYSFEGLVLPDSAHDQLLDGITFVEHVTQVFDVWGLRRIEPHPSVAINFRGPPGTGKTMAAHGAAHYLGKKIITARLSDLESRYHGQGPKNLVSLFETAHRENAVLFIDEAESLLSHRFADPVQAVESAINSMRTELLMLLDGFDGLIIFASNLPHSYDVAIESRLLHVDFPMPDRKARLAIWRDHLRTPLPLDPAISPERLADVEGITGRDIKMAVIAAAVGAARRDLSRIPLDLLLAALRRQAETVAQQPGPNVRIRDVGDSLPAWVRQEER